MVSKESIFYGLFVLTFIVLSGFVISTSYDLVTSGQSSTPGSTVSLLSFNVSNTSSVSGTNLSSVTLDIINSNYGNISEVNISDGTTNYTNSSILGSTVIVSFGSGLTITGETNLTVFFAISSNSTWNASFGASVTSIANESNITYSSLPYTSSLIRVNDSTDPLTGGTLSKTDSDETTITTNFNSSQCSDGFSGISSCELSSDSGTVEGNLIKDLSCGTTYSLTITATDNEGNTNSASYSLETSPCSGGGSDYVAPTWKNTYVITNNQFSQGYTNTLSANERVRIPVNGMSHHVGVKSISQNSALIEVASDSQESQIDLGSTERFDVNHDNFYDLSVKVNSIVSDSVDLTITQISEPVESSQEDISSSETSDTGDVQDEVSDNSSNWIWIIVIVVLLFLAYLFFFKLRKK